MPNESNELQAELEALKAQVHALTKAQEDCAEAIAAEGEVLEEEVAHGAVSIGGLTVELDELVELLKEEVEDVKPLTLLAVFGLGVLVGRLLAN